MKALACLTLWLACTSALADDAGLLRCRAQADGAARLACYDALPVAAEATPPASPQQLAQNFGLERQQQAAAAAGVDGIESVLPGPFEGWGANTRFKLANGQIWQVSDGSSAYAVKTSPRVKITRGMLGTFFLQFEGMNKSVRVKRVE